MAQAAYLSELCLAPDKVVRMIIPYPLYNSGLFWIFKQRVVTLAVLADLREGWDTHRQNFPNVQRLCETLDAAWAILLVDLRDRGLLETTLVVWMGEFGRTPRNNPQSGRDHFPAAWSLALCGGGIRGGQTVGRTSPDGMEVTERPVTTIDLLATICRALGIDPSQHNMSNAGRPIPLVDPEAQPVAAVL